ncbi:MAG: hypothetical protein HZC05_00905 [Candidatus Magasanikbacteria bacterium]|nr:hypothetical protein [Candidatus Magasanikbacteria bacterium]
MRYFLVLFFSVVFFGSFLIVENTFALTPAAWCKQGDFCKSWALYQKCEDGWTYAVTSGESPCVGEESETGAALDCSACNALAPESVVSCLQKCEAGGGITPAPEQPGSPSAGTPVGNFKNIGTKLGNVSKGFYGDVAPKTFEETVGGYIKTGLALVGVIFLLLMVYGGYTWMIARGDETEATKAKDTITMAAIGMAVVLIAYVITYFILSYALQSVGQ